MMKKKKILIRIGSLRHGGAEKALINFLKNIPSDKYEIDLLLNLYSGQYIKEVPAWINLRYLIKGDMITTNRIQDIPLKAFRVLYQKMLLLFPSILYKIILKGKQYDIEIGAIHGIYKEILSSPQKNSRKILWIQNDIFSLKEYTSDIIRKFFKFDKILVISNKLEEEMLKLASNEKERNSVVKIYNPIDKKDTLEKANAAIDDMPFKDSEFPLFVSVGTVYPQKGYDRLLHIHKKLWNEGFHHNLIIIGDGYDFENIYQLLDKLNIGESVKMLGYRSNPYPYVQQSDFYIMSSRHEGFPTIIAEALILEKPVCATDISGIKDLLQDGKMGIITQNSKEGIYDGMRQFITEKHLSEKYKAAIRNTELPFILEKSVQHLQEIIDHI
ncbi:Glycosyltransferase involved in cell wall bisynthesis [Chryseobacterium taichungense]|uniref:Glycosyltransferase involved in cell wall bisynthesis n=2 Tax=Chryseobacterium taichungense TaxID=295069 RepID=A0A1H7ZI13_9FLAO|nr:Glycosyltransferase involved in cell wall bisynthesis [Chryseobacterium taichungense]